MKVLCIAECCCDMIFAGLPRLPLPGEEIYGDSFAVCPGGGANTPLGLARLGGDVTLLTSVGDDPLGRRILDELARAGVRTVGRLGEPGTRTAVSAVLSTGEDRGFASYSGTGGAFFTPELLEEEIAGADIVHTYLGYCLSWPIVRLCERYGTMLSLDAAWSERAPSAEELEVLAHCDYLKVNEQEAARLAGTDRAEEALALLAGQVKRAAVITLGERGSIGMAGREAPGGGTLLRRSAVRAGPFRDACGAGDAYAAGMLLGISRGEDLAAAMGYGTELSGQCVTWLGGNLSGDRQGDNVRRTRK